MSEEVLYFGCRAPPEGEKNNLALGGAGWQVGGIQSAQDEGDTICGRLQAVQNVIGNKGGGPSTSRSRYRGKCLLGVLSGKEKRDGGADHYDSMAGTAGAKEGAKRRVVAGEWSSGDPAGQLTDADCVSSGLQ